MNNINKLSVEIPKTDYKIVLQTKNSLERFDEEKYINRVKRPKLFVDEKKRIGDEKQSSK